MKTSSPSSTPPAAGRRCANARHRLAIAIGGLYWLGACEKAGSARQAVAVGKDYYVAVSEAEVPARDRDGEPWDALDDSGPDVYYEIWWRGNCVYTSSTQIDTLRPRFKAKEINLASILRSGVAEARQTGAVVTIQAGDQVEVRLHDADVGPDDRVGEHAIVSTTLSEGATVFPTDGAAGRFALVVLPVADSGGP